MSRYGDWETLKELGRGGQGVVYLAKRLEGKSRKVLYREFAQKLRVLGAGYMQPDDILLKQVQALLDSLSYLLLDETSGLGALKVLKKAEDSAEYAKAKARMSDEVSAYKRICHPSVLRILDDDIENGWFVTEFHKRGSLWDNRLFAGNMEKSLEAFKSVVDAVCTVHDTGLVHRDIKPQNVFVANDWGSYTR